MNKLISLLELINAKALKLGATLRDDRRTPIEKLKSQYFKLLAGQRADGLTEYELRRNFEAKKQYKLLAIMDGAYDPKDHLHK